MSRNSTFGIIGGDARQVYLAKSISQDGYPVFVSCLEKQRELGTAFAFSERNFGEMRHSHLPLPATKRGKIFEYAFYR